jgi:hypothetical protein|tara:strand:- start:282 stop:647 length:366 start_codon:yes stop_codon:yes gene_type:complete
MLKSKQQKANDILIDTMEVLVKLVKNSQDRSEVMEDMLQKSALRNTLYCKFVEDRFDVDASEIANDFDKWISQYSEEELEDFYEGGELGETDQKIDAEVPGTLYTLDEIMSELEPPEEGSE